MSLCLRKMFHILIIEETVCGNAELCAETPARVSSVTSFEFFYFVRKTVVDLPSVRSQVDSWGKIRDHLMDVLDDAGPGASTTILPWRSQMRCW